MNSIARSFAFTLFGENESLTDTFLSVHNKLDSGAVNTVNQFICNFETCPTTGRDHIQGHIDCTEATRPSAIVRQLPELDGAHFEPARDLQASRDYARKEATAWDHGFWKAPGYAERGAGRACDREKPIDTMYKRLADMVEAGRTWNQIQHDFVKTNAKVFANNCKQLQAAYTAFRAVPKEQEVELRGWQKHIVQGLDAVPDGRTVTWIYDPMGNTGKSFLCNYLVTNMGAVMLDGRVQDMAYAYQGQPVVCIDIARAQSQNMDHLHIFAEKVASGSLFSSKYESVNKVFTPPHVIVFANVHHNAEMWTAGRCQEFDVQNYLRGELGAEIALRFM